MKLGNGTMLTPSEREGRGEGEVAKADKTDIDTLGRKANSRRGNDDEENKTDEAGVICTVIVQVLCVFSLVSEPLSRRPRAA